MSEFIEDSRDLDDEDEYEDDLDDDWDDDDDSDDLDSVSYVCEDCDYRWDEAAEDEPDSGMLVCPMCGSINVTQL